MSDRILITGGTGFAGSHLVEHLVKTTRSDIHVTSFSSQASAVDTFLPSENIHKLDLANVEATKQLFDELKPTAIYHLAALAAVSNSFANAESTIVSNTTLQLSVLEALKEKTPSARLLVVGSAQEYDLIGPNAPLHKKIAETHPLGPANPYGVSKVTQDLLGLAYFYSYGLDIVRVRPFNHIGERQPQGFAVSDFAQQIAAIERGQGQEISVGNLAPIRDFSDVKDVVRAYDVLMQKGVKGDVYNIGSGQGMSIQSMLDALLALSSVPITVQVDTAKYRPVDVSEIVADVSKIAALGWHTEIPINDTSHRVLNYWRTQNSF